jgi:catechol 2,3-dioxygenase-like lactoylglutathione lyase family enzyme
MPSCSWTPLGNGDRPALSRGQPLHESRTGLDHISFGVAYRAGLEAWANWLDELGIENSGVIDTDNPMPYSVVVFGDPDAIQLELFYMAV